MSQIMYSSGTCGGGTGGGGFSKKGKKGKTFW